MEPRAHTKAEVEEARYLARAEPVRLRDYFAAAALTGRLAKRGQFGEEVDAEVAYQIADAMLEARKK